LLVGADQLDVVPAEAVLVPAPEVVAELPVTKVGKLDKKSLRDLLAAPCPAVSGRNLPSTSTRPAGQPARPCLASRTSASSVWQVFDVVDSVRLDDICCAPK